MTVKLGWYGFPLGHKDAVLPFTPEPLDINIPAPIIQDWASRTFVIRAPFDIHIKCEASADHFNLEWLDPSFELSPVDVFIITKRDDWSAPDRPTIQWKLNNLFVADEPVIGETSAPVFHSNHQDWPGVYVPGRLDIHRWTRPFQWVFEWHDFTKPLKINRGDPILYFRVHTPNFDRDFSLQPLEYTREVEQAIHRCSTIFPYKKNALGMMDKAVSRRKKWLS